MCCTALAKSCCRCQGVAAATLLGTPEHPVVLGERCHNFAAHDVGRAWDVVFRCTSDKLWTVPLGRFLVLEP